MTCTGRAFSWRFFEVLRLGGYGRLWLGQLVSQLGDAFTEMALIYLVATLSDNPASIGLAIFATLLPTAVVGPFAGVLADRLPQRRILILSDLWRLAVVAAMVPAALARNVPLLLVLVAVEGLGTAFFSPARAALIPRLVGPQHVSQAVSISQSTAASVAIAGPALGGIVVAATSPAYAFAIDAATFAVSAALVATIRVPGTEARPSGPKQPYLTALRAGFGALSASPLLRLLTSVLVAFSLVFGVINTSLSGALIQEFGLSAQGFGGAQTARGAGAVAGSLVAPLLIATVGGSVLLLLEAGLVGALLAALVVVARILAGGGGEWAVYPWAVLLGWATASLNVTAQTLFMTVTPAELLGRVASLIQAFANGANLLGILGGGLVAASLSSLQVTAGAGWVTLGLAAVVLATPGFRAVRKQEIASRAAPSPAGPPAAGLAAGLSGLPTRGSLLIRDLDRWRPLFGPRALRLLALLEQRPRRADEMALALGEPPEVVERELARLVEAGAVVPPDQQPGPYTLGVKELALSPAALGGGRGVDELVARLIQPGLDHLRRLADAVPPDLTPEELSERLRAGGYQVQLTAQVVRLRRGQWADVARRLQEAVEQLVEASVRSGEGGEAGGAEKAGDEPTRTYVFTLLSFPLDAEAAQPDPPVEHARGA